MVDCATARRRHRPTLSACLLLALVGWAAAGPGALPGARARGLAPGVAAPDTGAAAGQDDQLHEVRASLAGLSSALHLLAEQDHLTVAARAQLSGMLGSEIERLQRLLDCPGSRPAQPVPLHAVPAPLVTTRRATARTSASGRWAVPTASMPAARPARWHAPTWWRRSSTSCW